MLKTVSSITNAIGALNFKGTWNASTNTPTIVSGVGVKGDYFVVSVAGSTTIDGISNWGVGDWITYNGTVWQRVEGGADLNGVNLSVSGTTTLSGLTASTALALDASKNVASVTNTGTGNNVLADGPTLTTPTLGVASATSINKVALTTPATGSTLTIADGKTLTANHSLTLAGTDATTMTFPSTSATIARTDAGQTFTGTQEMTSPKIITSINDTNGNEVFGITATGSAVNELTIANAATGNNPVISATGGDTNIGITLTPKGTGGVVFPAGAVGTPAITTTGDPNTGIYFPAADTIGFVEGGAEAMRIASTGQVRVGTANAGLSIANLHANGSETSAEFTCTRAADFGINVVMHRTAATGGEQIRFCVNNSGAGVGAIVCSATTTAYATSSDYRLKHHIQPMTGALAKVQALKPVTYKWKADDSVGEGFIAHEVQTIASYAVSGEKDGEQMQGVDYGKLTPILTAALQEAIAKIETLEARIAALETK